MNEIKFLGVHAKSEKDLSNGFTKELVHTVNPCIKSAGINIFHALQTRVLLECGYY